LNRASTTYSSDNLGSAPPRSLRDAFLCDLRHLRDQSDMTVAVRRENKI
jgi:hypothetical protein